MNKGIVADIQRFSLHDGPGIRTTVFLKGCFLRCAWCHNPETRKSGPQLMAYLAKCIGCGECLKACEAGVHQFHGTVHEILRDHCSGCGRCSAACPSGALVMAGKSMTVDEVLGEILEDQAFYGSDGGVTLSGGEPLFQPEFTLSLLRACKQARVHTAIETTFCYPWAKIEPLLEWIDLIMFDVKLADPEKHRQYTGVSSRELWENIRRLGECGKPLIARTPVMAGINDQEEEITQIAAALRKLDKLVAYELLPYHPLGLGKYQALGYPAPPFSAPSAETLSRLTAIAREAADKRQKSI